MSVVGEKSATANQNNGKQNDAAEGSSQISRLIQQEVIRYLSNLNPNLANLVTMLESLSTTRSFALTTFSSICMTHG